MTSSRLDRSLKLVWLVIGSLLLLGLVAGLVASAVSFFASGGGGGGSGEASVPAAGAQGARDVLPVRYGTPKPVPGSAFRVAEVRAPVAEGDDDDGGSSRSRGREETQLVNLLFLSPGEGGGRLLLDRPARIESTDYPVEGDSARPWITYRIAFRDTDGDGRLSVLDRAGLFTSTLGGDSLRPVLPEGMRLLAQSPLGDGRRLVVLALEVPADTTIPAERWRQRALLLDVPTGTLRPYTALDSLAAAAQAALSTRR